MKKLYEKSELTFALVWIAVYCVLQSLANPLNEIIGTAYAASAAFCVLQTIVLFVFIRRNGLQKRYGLCRSSVPARRFLYYVPLVILASGNLWNGAALTCSPAETVCRVVCMLCVGFLEEVIFRGLPEMIAQFATPVSTICMNHVLVANLGELGVNAFAVISYVASFSMSVLFGASEGLQPLFGLAYGAKHDENLKYYLRRGMMISLISNVLCTLLAVCVGRPICALFGAEGEVLDFTVKHMPEYAWDFIIAGLNTILSSYLYSTKRSVPAIFGSGVIWFTYGILECLVLLAALALTKNSERNGIIYQ